MSSLTHIVGQTAGASHLLKVDSNGKLGVNDATAQSELSSINTALSGSLTTSDITAHTKIDAITTALGGSLSVSDSASQGSLSAIQSSVAGTLQVASASTLSVSAPAISTTSSSLASALSVADSSTFTSSSVDLDAVKDFVILGITSDTSAQITTELSVDGSNWRQSSETPLYVSNGVFVSHQSSHARYVRFSYVNSSGGPKTMTMDISYKV